MNFDCDYYEESFEDEDNTEQSHFLSFKGRSEEFIHGFSELRTS